MASPVVAQHTESLAVTTTLCCRSSAFIFKYRMPKSSDSFDWKESLQNMARDMVHLHSILHWNLDTSTVQVNLVMCKEPAHESLYFNGSHSVGHMQAHWTQNHMQLQSSIPQLDALEINGITNLILFQRVEILLLQFLLAGWQGQVGLLKQQ